MPTKIAPIWSKAGRIGSLLVEMTGRPIDESQPEARPKVTSSESPTDDPV